MPAWGGYSSLNDAIAEAQKRRDEENERKREEAKAEAAAKAAAEWAARNAPKKAATSTADILRPVYSAPVVQRSTPTADILRPSYAPRVEQTFSPPLYDAPLASPGYATDPDRPDVSAPSLSSGSSSYSPTLTTPYMPSEVAITPYQAYRQNERASLVPPSYDNGFPQGDILRGEYNRPLRSMVPTEARPLYPERVTTTQPPNLFPSPQLDMGAAAQAGAAQTRGRQQGSGSLTFDPASGDVGYNPPEHNWWEWATRADQPWNQYTDDQNGGATWQGALQSGQSVYSALSQSPLLAASPTTAGLAAGVYGLMNSPAGKWANQVFYNPTKALTATPLDELMKGLGGQNPALGSGTGSSLSELYAPVGAELNKIINPFNPNRYGRNENPITGGFVANAPNIWNNIVTAWDQSAQVRQQINAAIKGGQPAAAMATLNFTSMSAGATLDDILNKEPKLKALHTEADRALMDGDMVRAAELGAQINELENTSFGDMVNNRQNITAELVEGTILDLTQLVSPVMEILGLTREAFAARRSSKLYDINQVKGLANIEPYMEAVRPIIEALQQGENPMTYARRIGQAVRVGDYGKALTEATVLFARTATGRAQTDTEWLYQGATQILNGITDKNVVRQVLTQWAQDPRLLLQGIQIPGGGTLSWGAGIVGNAELAKRYPILRVVGEQLNNLRALEGEGRVNPYDLFSQMAGVFYDGARRVNGIGVPGALPFGASDVRVRIVGNTGQAVIEYLGEKGKVVQRSVEMALRDANSSVQDIKAAMTAGGGINWAKLPFDVQRAIMSDTWLALRPANWIKNALGATSMLVANNSMTFLPMQGMLDDLDGKFTVQPITRLMETANEGFNILGSAQQATQSSGFFDNVAAFITKNPDNPVSRFMRGAYNIPYGSTEIPLPGGLAVPFGEQAFYTRAFYIPFKRALGSTWPKWVAQRLVPSLEKIGLDPGAIEGLANLVVDEGIVGNKNSLARSVREFITGITLPPNLRGLGIPDELISLGNSATADEPARGWRGLNDILSHATPEQAEQAIQEIRAIFARERNPFAGILGTTPPQLGVYDWMQQNIVGETAHIIDSIKQAATQAGVDPQQAAQQATEVATRYAQAQQGALDRFRGELSGSMNNSSAWNAAIDFWGDVMTGKARVRQTVDDASRAAMESGDWNKKWQATAQAWTGFSETLTGLADKYRTILGRVNNGGSYKSYFDWGEVVKRYMQWDEQQFRQLRGVELGAPSIADDWYQKIIDANRGLVDNAMAQTFEAFRSFPTLDSYDLLVDSMRKFDFFGAQASAFLENARTKLLPQAETQYHALRNRVWIQVFDNAAVYADASARTILANGIAEQTQSGLRWLDEFAGGEFQLLGPAGEGRWNARRLGDNTTHVFAEAGSIKKGDVASPPIIPQNVLNDYHTALGQQDKVVEQAMQEIKRTAPQVTPAPRMPYTAPTLEPVVGSEKHGVLLPATTIAQEPPLGVGLGGPGDVAGARQVAAEASGLPSGPPATFPTVNELRLRAKNASVATATEKGTGSDRWLINVINKDLGLNITGLNQLTGTQRFDAMAALEKRAAGGAAQAAGSVPPTGPRRLYEQPWLSANPSPVGPFPATTPPSAAFGERIGPAGRPTTENMFAATGEDLPLFSGAAPRGGTSAPFTPQATSGQESMFDLRPQMGTVEPSYKPKAGQQDVEAIARAVQEREALTPTVPSQPYKPLPKGRQSKARQGYSSVGGDAYDQSHALEIQRQDMRNAWNQEITSAVDGVPSLDTLVLQYARGGAVNFQKEVGGKVQDFRFEDILGRTVLGRPLNNANDVEAFVQAYVDTGREAQRLQEVWRNTQRYAKMPAGRIRVEAADIFKAEGYTEAQLANLDRETLLRIIEAAEDVPVEGVGSTYFAGGLGAAMRPEDLQAINQFFEQGIRGLFGITDDRPFHQHLLEAVTRGRRVGSNKQDEIGDVAQHMIRTLDEAERGIVSRLGELLTARPNRMTPEQQLRAIDLVDDFLPQYDNALAQASKVGETMADWAMLNFRDRRNFDSILALLYPFHYYWSRMPSRALTTALTKPSLVNLFYEAKRALAAENRRDENLPVRMEGSVPFMQTATGVVRAGLDSLLTATIPGMAYLDPNPFVEPNEANNDTERWLLNIQKYTQGLPPMQSFALDWTLDQTNPLPNGAKRTDKYNMGSLIPQYRGAGYALQALTGKTSPQEFWGGRPGASFWSWSDEFEMGRIGREIALIEQDPDKARYAQDIAYQVLKQTGPLPEQPAEAQALFLQGVKAAGVNRWLALAGAFALGIPVLYYPNTEKQLRGQSAQRQQLGFDAVDNPYGSQAAVKAFDAKNRPLDAWWAYGNLYPQQPRTPVPPTYPYGPQPFTGSDRPGVAAATDQHSAATSEVWATFNAAKAQYDAMVPVDNRPAYPTYPTYPGKGAGDAAWAAYRAGQAAYKAGQAVWKAADAEYDAQWKAHDAAEAAAGDALEKGIAAADAAYPSAEPSPERQPYVAPTTPQGADPTQHTAQPGMPDYYGNMNLDELNAAAAKNAEDQAKAESEAIKPNYDNEPVRPGDGATDAEWDAYYELKTVWDTAWDTYRATVADRTQELLADQGFMTSSVAGRPLGGSSIEQAATRQAQAGLGPNISTSDRVRTLAAAGLQAKVAAAALPKDAKAPAAGAAATTTPKESAARAARESAYYKNEKGGGPSPWGANWDEYNGLGDDWAAKAAYMLAHPEFAKYYKDKYGNSWWEEYQAGGNGAGGGFSRGGFSYGGGGGGGGYVDPGAGYNTGAFYPANPIVQRSPEIRPYRTWEDLRMGDWQRYLGRPDLNRQWTRRGAMGGQ